ncbi:hypothetical protein EDD22DRAFT_954287 [Suillus occidentalis]|nr:hypothetical protein EDD22DRAFT_954287 [Suillus occidentalis]
MLNIYHVVRTLSEYFNTIRNSRQAQIGHSSIKLALQYAQLRDIESMRAEPEPSNTCYIELSSSESYSLQPRLPRHWTPLKGQGCSLGHCPNIFIPYVRRMDRPPSVPAGNPFMNVTLTPNPNPKAFAKRRFGDKIKMAMTLHLISFGECMTPRPQQRPGRSKKFRLAMTRSPHSVPPPAPVPAPIQAPPTALRPLPPAAAPPIVEVPFAQGRKPNAAAGAPADNDSDIIHAEYLDDGLKDPNMQQPNA